MKLIYFKSISNGDSVSWSHACSGSVVTGDLRYLFLTFSLKVASEYFFYS